MIGRIPKVKPSRQQQLSELKLQTEEGCLSGPG